MRVVGLAGLVLLASVGAAVAGPPPACDNAPLNTGNSGSITYFGGFIVSAGGSQSCNAKNDVAIPKGKYGVFRVDTQGFATLADGDKVKFKVTSNGQTHGVVVDNEYFDDVRFVRDYSTGLTSSPKKFSATAVIDGSAMSDGGSSAEINEIDILAGWTSMKSVKGSLNEVGKQQAGLITHLDFDAGLLTGANQPLEGGNEIGLVGGVGSYDFGVTGRYNLAQGFSLLGGASIVSLGTPGATTSGGLVALTARYVEPTADQFRLYGEGGVQGGLMSMGFSRHYDNGIGADPILAKGSGDAQFGAIYAKGGVLWQPDANNQILFSASLKETALGFSKYGESDGNGASPNLFSADFAGNSSYLTTVKAGADWTTNLQPDLDLTASLAVGATLNSGATAKVFGVGTVTGDAQSTLFTEYGVRLGWTPTANTRIDGFVGGTTGTGIGTHAQVGAGAHLKF